MCRMAVKRGLLEREENGGFSEVDMEINERKLIELLSNWVFMNRIKQTRTLLDKV